MSFNIVDTIQSFFNNEFAGRAATHLGESESSVKTALSAITPSVLTGLLHKAGTSDPHSIFNMVKDAPHTGVLGSFGGSLGNTSLLSQGSDILKSLFGSSVGNVSSLIAKFSGTQPSSASTLMNLATPAVLGYLGKHAIDNNMTSHGFLSFLHGQKDNIVNAVPSGLNLAGALGLGSLAGIGTKLSGKLAEFGGAASHSTSRPAHIVEEKKNDRRWLPWILGAIGLLVLILLLSRGCNGSETPTAVTPVDTVAKAVDSVAIQAPAVVRESLKVKLPNGVELDAYKGGIEDQLVAFLNDPASVPGKNVWFDFDNLNFNTGSAVITDESQAQVKNIAAILTAYPNVKIKIGGYTDKTGDSLSNLKLSQSRADAVVAALTADGSKKNQVLGGEGYGSQFAKAAADAPDDERVKDRRIAVSVRAK